MWSDEERNKWRKQAEARERNRLLGFLRRKGIIYCIEGEWSGYNSSQQRVVHREYTPKADRADAVKKLGLIRYTDGTVLFLRTYGIKSKEQILPKIDGYTSLIDKAIRTGISDVAKMP
mgnify:FL=1